MSQFPPQPKPSEEKLLSTTPLKNPYEAVLRKFERLNKLSEIPKVNIKKSEKQDLKKEDHYRFELAQINAFLIEEFWAKSEKSILNSVENMGG